MKKKKTIINYSDLSNDELIALGWYIIFMMTGNASLPNPDPTLIIFEGFVEVLETKNTAAKEGGRTANAELRAARLDMLNCLKDEALYVEKVAKGDEVILTSSGFNLWKDPRASIRQSFWAKAGSNSGEVLIGCVAFPKAIAYVWQSFDGAAAPIDEALWKWRNISAQANTVLTDNIRGHIVWFRYCAVTRDGMQTWSEPISILIV